MAISMILHWTAYKRNMNGEPPHIIDYKNHYSLPSVEYVEGKDVEGCSINIDVAEIVRNQWWRKMYGKKVKKLGDGSSI